MNNETELEIKNIAIKLADSFCKSESRNFKELDKSKFDDLFIIYDSLKLRLKNAMKDTDKIDRHKIVSLVVISVLEIDVFETNNKHKKTVSSRNAVYILALQVALAVLNQFPENKKYNFRFQNNYLNEFIQLLHSNYDLLTSIHNRYEGEKKDKNINIVFFISHIFYWIEKSCIVIE